MEVEKKDRKEQNKMEERTGSEEESRKNRKKNKCNMKTGERWRKKREKE